MAKNILNVHQQFLAYTPVHGTTDNPSQRNFDWTRRIYSIPIAQPVADTKVIPPFASLTVFDGIRPIGLTTSSVLELGFRDQATSVYRLKVVSGPSAFRTARAVTGVTDCTVVVNNDTLATFTFNSGTALTGVQPGDIFRAYGEKINEPSTSWNAINSGLWIIVGVNGTAINCMRPTGEVFEAVAETLSVTDADFEIYSPDGAQIGEKFQFNDILGMIGRKTFQIMDVTPTTMDFVSTEALPIGLQQNYVTDSIKCVKESKRFFSMEVDQEAVVRFDGDTSDTIRVSPIYAGQSDGVGFFTKWGESNQCVIVNKSLVPLNVRFFTAE